MARRIGSRIKRLREARGLTQLDLSKRARVSQPYLSQLEAGTKANPALRVAQRLAKALGVPINALLPTLLAGLLGLAVIAPASAESQRVDLFDQHGRRIGSAVVDESTGRVDPYDQYARRIGWGHVRPDGSLDLFALDGRRLESFWLFPSPAPGR
jgi:transcriptional regulator with XRE-family HTH domain